MQRVMDDVPGAALLEAGYRAMAADTQRELEAQQWCNALAADINDMADEAW